MTHLPSLPAKATLIGLFKTLPETKRCCAGHRRSPRPNARWSRPTYRAWTVAGIEGMHAAPAERLGGSARGKLLRYM